MLMLASVTNVTPVADLEGIAVQSTTVVSEPERRGILLAGTPHGAIWIDGDANFSDTALLEGWPGDGSPENPFIIDWLDIDLSDIRFDAHPIVIRNTRVSFTISNCRLTGASRFSIYRAAGIGIENVTNGELVNNTCNNNDIGISLGDSHSNTVANNTCNNNYSGITLYDSDYNTVANNICNNNTEYGIWLYGSNHNTVTDNTCNSNNIGISLGNSHSNTVVNNACFSNTEHDIYLDDSDSNTVENNITTISENFVYSVLLLFGFVGITLLGSGWREVSARGGLDNIIVPVQKARRRLETRLQPLARGSPDVIIVPTRYRLGSWFRRRRTLKHVDVDETHEPDS
jgi:parallel beta-helix repeat protein